MSEDELGVGPVDWIVVEFPGNKMTGEAWPILVDLHERGIIRVLDMVFIRKDLDGTITAIAVTDLDGDGTLDLAVFQGASSGLLGEDDITEAAKAVDPGNSAGLLLYENTWAAPFATALLRAGAQMVASGRIPVTDVIAALDALEAAEQS